MNPQPFQTMAEVREYVAGDRIHCLVCGKPFHRLGHKHLELHDMTADDYRAAFGIPWKFSLTSKPSREATGRAMTPERIAKFKLCKPKRNTKYRPVVLACHNQWTAIADRGRAHASRLVTTGCGKCGAPVQTTALCATQPIYCDDCASPDSLKQRAYYQRRKAA